VVILPIATGSTFFQFGFLFCARKRSEATMRFNHFDSTILGTLTNGQGFTNAVEGTHRLSLRALISQFARSLSLRGSWRALKRMPAGSIASGLIARGGMTPIAATCPSYSGLRQQRHERSMPVVVVDPGTVGVC
jgi:hypothetical protein